MYSWIHGIHLFGGDMQVGYVIPSIGRDLNQLEVAIRSALNQSPDVGVVIVSPVTAKHVHKVAADYGIHVVFDSANGVPAAFNLGVEYIQGLGAKYFGVLGEDDVLMPNSMINLIRGFASEEVQAVVGRIWYVNKSGEVVFHNRAFPELLPILHFIPNVIPHPGSLCRISAWQAVNGFDPQFKCASDLDFWLKIRRLGKIARVECPMSYFGFSDLGYTAKFRDESISEGRLVRKKHTSPLLYPLQIGLDLCLTKLGERLIQRKNT
jgi:glycosyltransferase involved in cell wall biosynthesis